MKIVPFANAATLGIALTDSALAADMPRKAEPPFATRFTWTGCYLGGQSDPTNVFPDNEDVGQNIQVVKVGLSFRIAGNES
ncbi:hypothetical protein V4R08_17310 (plasmid) [Nitrobacter sp. NHB1]|uniref:hypothetical protein n=1 Tax=Nitrobacter sp. NHB1 TaxID=3119830 RepID=UPI0030006576